LSDQIDRWSLPWAGKKEVIVNACFIHPDFHVLAQSDDKDLAGFTE
jgi:hypothetical protein